MTTKNHAQIATLLTFQESLCASLRQFMNAQTASEPLPSLTGIISSTTDLQMALMNEMHRLAIEGADGSDDFSDEIPF